MMAITPCNAIAPSLPSLPTTICLHLDNRPERDAARRLADTMSHMITSAGAALVLLHFMSVPESSRPSWGQFNLYKSRLGPIALCTTFNIALNNASLTLVSLFVNQVIKACAPLPSIIFSYLVASKRYSWAIVCAVLCICAGSVLADFHNLTTGADSDPLGIILCLISLLANALKPVMASKADRALKGPWPAGAAHRAAPLCGPRSVAPGSRPVSRLPPSS